MAERLPQIPLSSLCPCSASPSLHCHWILGPAYSTEAIHWKVWRGAPNSQNQRCKLLSDLLSKFFHQRKHYIKLVGLFFFSVLNREEHILMMVPSLLSLPTSRTRIWLTKHILLIQVNWIEKSIIFSKSHFVDRSLLFLFTFLIGLKIELVNIGNYHWKYAWRSYHWKYAWRRLPRLTWHVIYDAIVFTLLSKATAYVITPPLHSGFSEMAYLPNEFGGKQVPDCSKYCFK